MPGLPASLGDQRLELAQAPLLEANIDQLACIEGERLGLLALDRDRRASSADRSASSSSPAISAWVARSYAASQLYVGWRRRSASSLWRATSPAASWHVARFDRCRGPPVQRAQQRQLVSELLGDRQPALGIGEPLGQRLGRPDGDEAKADDVAHDGRFAEPARDRHALVAECLAPPPITREGQLGREDGQQAGALGAVGVPTASSAASSICTRSESTVPVSRTKPRVLASAARASRALSPRRWASAHAPSSVARNSGSPLWSWAMPRPISRSHSRPSFPDAMARPGAGPGPARTSGWPPAGRVAPGRTRRLVADSRSPSGD